jgi:hypothetical protein
MAKKKTHKLNEDLRSRLDNYKFQSATKYLEGEPEEVKRLVIALACTFGNPGWGVEGNMGLIVENALENIGLIR